MRAPPNPLDAQRRRPRQGCMGCLTRMILLFLLLGMGYLAVLAVFAPWGFFLGGSFHIIPYWRGWGKLHARSGDYVLLVNFEPAPNGSHTLPSSHMKGFAYLCTPRGQRFNMMLGGDMRAHLGTSTNGEAIGFYMNNWPLFTGGFIADHRPSIELRGHWQNPNLVMDDHGSIARAFLPDGSVFTGHDPNRPYMAEVVPITLVPGTKSDFDAACRAQQK